MEGKEKGEGEGEKGGEDKELGGGWEEEREVGRRRGERGISYLFRRRMERKKESRLGRR